MENIYHNPVVLKVENGTQRSDVNLCLSCRAALHVRAAQSSNEFLLCSASGNPPMRLREPVGQCSHYQDKSKPSLYDMREVAWLVMTDKGGRSIGFLSPEELRQREQDSPPAAPAHGF